jgi:hypothetical protein
MSWWLRKADNEQKVSTDPVEEVSLEQLGSGAI